MIQFAITLRLAAATAYAPGSPSLREDPDLKPLQAKGEGE